MLHVESLQSRSRLYRWEIEPHVHRGLQQLIWLADGAVDVALDETRVSCPAPAAIVVPAGVVHAFRFAPESAGCVLTLSAQSLVEGEAPAVGERLRRTFDRAGVLPLPPSAPETRQLGALFDALLAEFAAHDGTSGTNDTQGPPPRWLARAAVWRVTQLGAERARAADAAARPRQALFTRFVALVEAHHLEHWPVGRYASVLGLSPERLNRIVRDQAGIGALALIHQRLVREACRRLVYVAVPVSKLADELGFGDAAYFCRFFKRHTGCAPGEYRRGASSERRR
jgi:AraC family transcriptional activator of pobA